MSYEYIAKIKSPLRLGGVIEAGNLPETAVILPMTDEKVLLRWNDAPMRSSWPEDVTVLREGSDLFVQIHAGQRDKIARFLSQLAQSVEKITGESIEFEEL